METTIGQPTGTPVAYGYQCDTVGNPLQRAEDAGVSTHSNQNRGGTATGATEGRRTGRGRRLASAGHPSHVRGAGQRTRTGTDSNDGGGHWAAATAESVASCEYSPFGMPLVAHGPLADTNPFRFSTKFRDDRTEGMYRLCGDAKCTHGRMGLPTAWLALGTRFQQAAGMGLSGQPSHAPSPLVSFVPFVAPNSQHYHAPPPQVRTCRKPPKQPCQGGGRGYLRL